MNVFGIGAPEIGIIAVVALLIFGPGKLPEVMGQAGKLVRDFRRMSAELTGEFEKTIAEAKDIGASIQNEVGGMSSQVNSVTNSVKKDLGIKGAGSTAKSKPGVTSRAAASSRSTSTTTSKAGGKPATSSSKSSTTSAATKSGAAANTTSTSPTASAAAKKPAIPVASREDPAAGFSLFEPAAVERPRRTRTATPAAIADRTPRGAHRDVTAAGESSAAPTAAIDATAVAADDPLSRARQRRRTAGYARQSA